ncbi:cytochrome P450 3A14-like [Dermacentor variabilis]|uniref:cytochrome P450 3A14-like n=1 Tax=Dermacentor variabilis TaxID=34621 RepID=UPI003F5C4B1C
MSTTAVLLLLTVLLLVVLFIWRWRHFSYFKRLGIPGPKPNLIWGNLMEYHSTDLYKAVGGWIEKYGDMFGFYNGDVPFVVTQDLELIEQVYVRKFQNFMNRGLTMMTDQMHPFLGKSIIHVNAPMWKSIRNSVAYGFSAAKLKQMMPFFEEDVNFLLKSLEKNAETGEEVQMYRKYEQLSMDFVARGAFGIDERFQENPDHPLFEMARTTCCKIMTGPFHMIAQSTTSLGPVIKLVCWLSLAIGDFVFDMITANTAKVIEKRKKDPSLRKPDILQNLLDAEYVESQTGAAPEKGGNGVPKTRALTTEEVITSAATLFIAGYETIVTSLSYLTFTLAKYPDIQEKARQEIEDVISQGGKLDYDTVMKKLNYLEQVMNETMRLYPPGLTFVTRQAKEDFEYKGLKFKAGTCFMVPQLQIQRDPRFWSDPLKFNPDRFAPENEAELKKMAFCPFGIGPRNCVGLRIATLQTKFTIAKVLHKFRLELGPSQMGKMDMGSRAMVSTPACGPWIICHRLNKSA